MTEFDKQLAEKNINHQDIDAHTWDYIYSIGGWEGLGSGGGSLLHHNTEFIEFLNNLNIQSMIDLGCGDLQYITSMDGFYNIDYLGVDGSKFIIDRIKDLVPTEHADILEYRTDKYYDLLLCKDVVQHVVQSPSKFSKLLQTIQLINAKTKYIVTDQQFMCYFHNPKIVFVYKCGFDTKCVIDFNI